MTVFRLKTQGNIPLADGIDWFLSNEYNSNVISSFPDPDGGKGNEPTSIPSPFARIDLVRTAFKYVNEGAQEDTTFYKIVSDTLDVAEIFFNYNRLNSQIQIHEWDKTNEILRLTGGDSINEHRILGEALELFLTQDAGSFNFSRTSKIYLLEYNSKIIGGTSPLTLFFPSANDLNWVDISFPNGDRAFDSGYCPLYKREPEFQKMLYSMRAKSTAFVSSFREFSRYMDRSLESLKSIDNLTFSEINEIIRLGGIDYNTSNYSTIGSNGVFILDSMPFFGSKGRLQPIKSDFEIQSVKYSGEPKPLVLQKGHNGKRPDGSPMIYVTAPYDQNMSVDYFDSMDDFSKRKLPGVTAVQYPYLTISDFLEPYIIRTIFPINKKNFWDGNLQKRHESPQKGYLLPIKRLFFDFFDFEDLNSTMPDGNPTFEMVEGNQGQITVTLRIPIKDNNYISYERIYYPPQVNGRDSGPDLVKNRGSIVENEFSVSLFPNFKLSEKEDNFFRVCLVESDILPTTKNLKYAIDFYKFNGEKTKVLARQHRSEKKDANVNSHHYVIERDYFEFLEVGISSGAKGLIVPNLKQKSNGVLPSVFAIDFGTTNTHVEYSIGEENVNPKPFEITESDQQIAFLHDVTNEMLNEDQQEDQNLLKIARSLGRLTSRLLHETMPEIISDSGDFSFPFRSAIASKTSLNILGETHTLADLNIPFYYEKIEYQSQIEKVIKNLKWDNAYVGNEKYIKHFFEQLIFLIRNKILINGGNLKKVKLVCSHPTSMLSWRRDLLQKTWKELYQKLISMEKEPIFISESISPFYFLKRRGGITAINKPVVSIDIGGETTDVVIYLNEQPQIVSSMRFATNAIFGDGFNNSPETNGFVQKYKDEIISLLDKNNLGKIKRTVEGVINTSNSSSDIINVFFSIENNKVLNPKGLVSFNDLLTKDHKLKVVFVIFYSAIIYHIARIIKNKGIPIPAYISFSGMGSKVINVIGESSLNLLTKKILSLVLGGSNGEISIKQHPEPKQITARGSIYYGVENAQAPENIKAVLLGDFNNTFVENGDEISYSELNESILESVAQEFVNFLEVFETLNKELNFRDNFGFSVDEFREFKKLLADKDKVMEYLKLGIKRKVEQLNNQSSEPIEESLFFYPLIGGLNRLAYDIYANNQNNKD